MKHSNIQTCQPCRLYHVQYIVHYPSSLQVSLPLSTINITQPDVQLARFLSVCHYVCVYVCLPVCPPVCPCARVCDWSRSSAGGSWRLYGRIKPDLRLHGLIVV